MYLHYPITLEQAKESLSRIRAKWQVAERMHQMKVEQSKWRRPVPAPLQREIRRLHKDCINYEIQSDTLSEVIAWHEDPDSLIESYIDHGFTLAYRVNNQEFETYEEALAEAQFVHSYNDAILEFGADGEGFDDLVPAEDMIQAVFMKED